MTDKFEEFESNIYNWVSRHKVGLMVVGLVVVLWVMLSITVVVMGGVVGWSMVEKNITESYNNGDAAWQNGVYDVWESWLFPIIVQMFNTMGWLILLLGGGYAILLSYLFLKWSIRKNKNV